MLFRPEKMTKFDFISVLVSIVFGLGLTHVCGGAFQLAHRRQLGTSSLLLAGFTFLVIVLNWWMFFAWHDRTEWKFEALLTLVAWALSFYGMAFGLFPPDTGTAIDPATRYRRFALALSRNTQSAQSSSTAPAARGQGQPSRGICW